MTLKERWAVKVLQGEEPFGVVLRACPSCNVGVKPKCVLDDLASRVAATLLVCPECGHVWRGCPLRVELSHISFPWRCRG